MNKRPRKDQESKMKEQTNKRLKPAVVKKEGPKNKERLLPEGPTSTEENRHSKTRRKKHKKTG